MQYLVHLIKNYPLSLLIILGIWIVCIIPIPENPLSQVSMMDKWTHIVLYTILGCCIWTEYLRRHTKIDATRLFWLAFMAPLAMGGLIEIVQATCTGGNRSGDWLDFLANSFGVVASQLIGILLARCFARRKKDS